jgi:3-hydroxyisobutyrate dehydrogenase
MNALAVSVGFIGIGAMGWPMAARLAPSCSTLVVFDSSQSKKEAFIGAYGGTYARTCAELAALCDVIVTMLPTSAIVESVLVGEHGVLKSMRAGTIIVEMSSGVPTKTRRLATMVEQHGGILVDAPVSGGVARAKTGELAIMVGGDPSAIAKVEPILALMGTSILKTGVVGSGHAMKALNNLVSAAGFLIGVEAMLIAKAFGLDPATLVDVLNASTGVNNSTQKKFKQFVLSRSFNSGFSLDLMVKDLSIALELAKEAGSPAPFASLCRELWAAAGKQGPNQDHTAMAKLSETIAGRQLS